jgi:drug/metabolite transporter (DMT)-like permease
MKADKKLALLALLACSLLWSSGGVLIKSISLPPLAISGGRSLFAALFILLVRGWPKWTGQPAFIAAVLAYAGTLSTFTAATTLTTAANAILLQYTAPLFVCLFSWLFYREKPRWPDLLAICLILGGLVLFFSDSLAARSGLTGWTGRQAIFGDALALLSGIFFGLLAVMMRRVRLLDCSPTSVLVYGNLLCVLVAAPFMLRKIPAVSDLAYLLILGLAQIGLAYLLYVYALPQVSALELILIPMLEPLLNPVWVYLLRGEKPGAASIAGGLFIMAVVTGWSLWRDPLLRRKRLPPA